MTRWRQVGTGLLVLLGVVAVSILAVVIVVWWNLAQLDRDIREAEESHVPGAAFDPDGGRMIADGAADDLPPDAVSSSQITVSDGDSGTVDLDVQLGDATVEEIGDILGRVSDTGMAGWDTRLRLRATVDGRGVEVNGHDLASWEEMSPVLASPLTEGHHLGFGLRGEPELTAWWREPGSRDCDPGREVDAAVDLMVALAEETGWAGDGDPRVRVDRDACGTAAVSLADPVVGREEQRVELIAMMNAVPPETGRLRLLTHVDERGTRLSVSTLDRERGPDDDLAAILARWSHGPVSLNGVPVSG